MIKVKYRTLKILLDYGTSATIISNSPIPKSWCKKKTTNKWDTHVGLFQTQIKSTVLLELPYLVHTKTITYDMHKYDTNNSHQYEIIMVQELIQELGIDIRFSDCTVRGESPGPFEVLYTHMQDFQEIIDTCLNDEIISDEIYYVKMVK